MHLAKTIVHINGKGTNKIFNYYYFLTKAIVHINGKGINKNFNYYYCYYLLSNRILR